MNLNFIQDNDKIHVETQNQIAYKEEIILKMKLLKEDHQDYSKINPVLNDVNLLFSQIVKDLYEHVTNFKQKTSQMLNQNNPSHKDLHQPLKKKKKISVPYHTIRKLQSLKQKLITCRKTIQSQNRRYRSLNINRQNEKKSDVRFYKTVLQSYENQRQYFKKETLDLEDRVQEVEAVVKDLAYNDNHEFTDYESKIMSYEAIFKYEKKMNAFGKVVEQIGMIKWAKERVRKFLENKIGNDKLQQICDQNPQNSLVYGKNFFKTSEQMLNKINLLKRQKTQILQTQINHLINQTTKLQTINKKLKKAILQSQSQKYFMDMESKIKKYKQGYLEATQKKIGKITKTDFMIYLKDLDRRIKQYFQSKEIVYRCKSFVNDGINQTRSKSVCFSRPAF